ncbi:hypothetical protein M513_03162 [Trichuris suis]|uniref:Uncharacterized protein n=1 Tax=Trichuris suis TaxID=68888 RepID=A0A085MFP2_9BILA|nr:hypothetical protein M513_03162 [Trichuris suis]
MLLWRPGSLPSYRPRSATSGLLDVFITLDHLPGVQLLYFCRRPGGPASLHIWLQGAPLELTIWADWNRLLSAASGWSKQAAHLVEDVAVQSQLAGAVAAEESSRGMTLYRTASLTLHPFLAPITFTVRLFRKTLVLELFGDVHTSNGISGAAILQILRVHNPSGSSRACVYSA